MDRLWVVIIVFLCSCDLSAQMGIGTDMPDPAAELEIKSSHRGLLIPRISLLNTNDQTTISAGNIESLLVFNTTSNSTLSPGFYYWYNNQWKRLNDDNLPDNLLIWDEINQQLYFINAAGEPEHIDLNFNQTLTSLNYDPETQILTYLDENEEETHVFLDFSSAEINFVDGAHTEVFVNQEGAYSIDVSIAKGAASGQPSTYGVVREISENPVIRINQEGELSLDTEHLNQIKIVNQDYSALAEDRIIIGEPINADVTITLPDPAGLKGKVFTIKKENTNEEHYVKVMGNIAGLSANQILYTAIPTTGWELISDGEQWRITNKF